MCPLVFTRRKARRTAPTSSNDYPLYPIPNESSTARSAPPIPQGFPNLGISVTPAEAAHEAPVQHGSFSAGSGQGILGDIRNHPSDLLTALPQTAASDPSLAENPQFQANSPDLDYAPMEDIPTAGGPTARPTRWFCHMCCNGPHNIALVPSCTGMTSAGICGHPKCPLCTEE